MLVYGDARRWIDPRVAMRELDDRVRTLAGRSPSLARHTAMVGALIEAGAIAQGVADAETGDGPDARRPISDAALGYAYALAANVVASWRHGWQAPLRLLAPNTERWPEAVELRRPEGFAYYAVYPEAYAEAALQADDALPGARTVVGIRSIGTTLAASVAAATGASLPVTVRPRGHPFRRTLHVAPELRASWKRARRIAIVDEGPGLSGSSFGAVLDVAGKRVECYPSHAGELGPQASPAHRLRWRRATRHHVDADQLLLASGRLAGWLTDLVGPLTAPLEDLSAGRWRTYRREGDPPPVIAQQERRKLLVRAERGTFLARFVGLGQHGDDALALARRLSPFVPEVIGSCHGFLVERWVDGVPLNLARCGRPQLVATLGAYLARRAREVGGVGATLAELVEMARHNAEQAGVALELRAPSLEIRRVRIDGKLHACEWLVARGALIKTDAIDHHAAHDLVGCQDIAWDLAGAECELGLAPDETGEVARRIAGTSGQLVDPELVRVLRPCYLAFQLGRHAMALASATPEDARTLSREVDRYRSLLLQPAAAVRTRVAR
jgi:hypothetical protein